MSLSPQSIVYQQAHISDNRQGDVILAATICLFAAYSATLLRFIARRLAKAPLMTDDWMLVLGLVSGAWKGRSALDDLHINLVFLQFFTTATTADALLCMRPAAQKGYTYLAYTDACRSTSIWFREALHPRYRSR